MQVLTSVQSCDFYLLYCVTVVFLRFTCLYTLIHVEIEPLRPSLMDIDVTLGHILCEQIIISWP